MCEIWDPCQVDWYILHGMLSLHHYSHGHSQLEMVLLFVIVLCIIPKEVAAANIKAAEIANFVFIPWMWVHTLIVILLARVAVVDILHVNGRKTLEIILEYIWQELWKWKWFCKLKSHQRAKICKRKLVQKDNASIPIEQKSPLIIYNPQLVRTT